MAVTNLEIWLIRHGETAWSLSGAHTSRTDIPLTQRGRERAREIENYLRGVSFSMVLTSPMLRARETCDIAGFGKQAEIDDDLMELNYGIYEGRTTEDIQREIPDWSVWSSPLIDGETLDEAGERANRVIARAVTNGGRVALFAHGHILRILAACWIQTPPVTASRLVLGTGAISTLGFEHETRAITMWNRPLE